VVDETLGPVTKKEYELFDCPAGDDVFGNVFDFLGMVGGGRARACVKVCVVCCWGHSSGANKR